MGNQVPGFCDLGNHSNAAMGELLSSVPAAFQSVWASVRDAQRLLRVSGPFGADADRVHRVLLAQVLERIGPEYAVSLLRVLSQWCAGDLRDRLSVSYLHGLRVSWARDLIPIMREPMATGTDGCLASVSFGPLLRYDDLARLVAADSVSQLSDDFGQLQSGGRASGDLAVAPRPDEVLWVTGLSMGLRLLDVAFKYGVSERTLYRRLGECRSRFKVDSNRELVTVFARNGWLEVDPV